MKMYDVSRKLVNLAVALLLCQFPGLGETSFLRPSEGPPGIGGPVGHAPNQAPQEVEIDFSVVDGSENLRLEIPQEGDPENPRALILIHGVNSGRETWNDFLEQWERGTKGEMKLGVEQQGNWGLKQYCAVYTFEYPAKPWNMRTAPEIAESLVRRVRSNDFDESKLAGSDQRPELRDSSIIVLGHSHGGLVAREFALQGREGGLKILKAMFLGSPLNGLSLMELMSRAPILFEAKTLITAIHNRALSKGWRWITEELPENPEQWLARYSLVYEDSYVVYGRLNISQVIAGGAANSLLGIGVNKLFGKVSLWENILYTRAFMAHLGSSDGLIPVDSAQGTTHGPGEAVKAKQELPGHAHIHIQLPFSELRVVPGLTSASETYDFFVEEVLKEDGPLINGWLEKRKEIEHFYERFLDREPYLYWNLNEKTSKLGRTTKEELFEQMWRGPNLDPSALPFEEREALVSRVINGYRGRGTFARQPVSEENIPPGGRDKLHQMSLEEMIAEAERWER